MSWIRSRWWTRAETDPTHLAAGDWLVRLQNPGITVEETLAWEAWMRERPEHAEAFERLEQLSQLMPDVRPPKPATRWELVRDRYDATAPLKEWRVPRQPGVLALAASVALVALALNYVVRNFTGLNGADTGSDVVTTAVGENRAVSLNDGSRVMLGGDSRVVISLSDDRREIELSRGEALFTVARDAKRPFRVLAGDTAVVALGTEFNVRRGSDHAVVSVTEGRVRVEPVTHFLPIALLKELKPKLRPVNLDAGQQTQADSAGIAEATWAADSTAATSWRTGQLAFRLQPLQYVLEDVNRYAQKRIVLDEERLGSLMITGMVTRENIGGWIESLERGFQLQAVEEKDRIVLKALSTTAP